MKNLFIFLVIIVSIVSACNNSNKKPKKQTSSFSAVDSLIKDIDKGHMDGMGKIGRLHNTRKSVQAMLDSIGRLPVQTQKAASAFADNLKTTIQELDYADMAMDKWMTEYVEDSAIENEQARLNYLKNEKIKVDNVSAAIRNSLKKADSLLNLKF